LSMILFWDNNSFKAAIQRLPSIFQASLLDFPSPPSPNFPFFLAGSTLFRFSPEVFAPKAKPKWAVLGVWLKRGGFFSW